MLTTKCRPAAAVKETPDCAMLTAWSKVMSWSACNVTLLFAVLITEAATTWSPLPVVDPVPSARIVKSFGSKSQSPALPPGERVSTCAVFPTPSVSFPEVSTWPPGCPAPRPRAEIRPSNCVAPSAHTTTLPPAPCFRASAWIKVAASTVVVCARFTVPLPCQSPPTNTSPPPRSPLASSLALVKATVPPVTSIRPPFRPFPRADASIRPLTSTRPPLPPRRATSSARISPLCCTAIA